MEFFKRTDISVQEVTAMISGLTKKKELMIAVGEITDKNELQATCYIPSRGRWLFLKHDHLENVKKNTIIKQILIPSFKQVRNSDKFEVLRYSRSDRKSKPSCVLLPI
jgi:hypothetical protein